MTYREKIQQLITTINSVYDDSVNLRDLATLEEKKHWNEVRRIFYSAANPLHDLDNSLSTSRAKMEI